MSLIAKIFVGCVTALPNAPLIKFRVRYRQRNAPYLYLVQKLPVEQLEELGEALLDFTSVTDLQTWLQFTN
ncbi:MAG: DUF4351 domain-containing protein [Dolichospermum sp. UKL202]